MENQDAEAELLAATLILRERVLQNHMQIPFMFRATNSSLRHKGVGGNYRSPWRSQKFPSQNKINEEQN